MSNTTRGGGLRFPTFRRLSRVVRPQFVSRARKDTVVVWVLAMATERGLPVGAALDACADDLDQRSREQISQVIALLDNGMPLADALQTVPGLLPPETILSIRVGQEAGILPEILRIETRRMNDQLMNYDSEYSGLLMYFIAVGVALFGLLSFLMIYIAPKYKKIFEDFELSMPEITTEMLWFSDWSSKYFFAVLPAAVAVVWLLVGYAASLDRRFRNEPRRFTFLQAPPFLRGLVLRQATAEVMRRLSVVIAAGRPVAGSVSTMAHNHPHELVGQKLSRVFVELENGGACWRSFQNSGLLSRREALLLDSAERVGNLPWVLNSVADRINRQVDQKCRLLLEFIRPTMLLTMGAVVGFFMISYFLPLVKLINDLS